MMLKIVGSSIVVLLMLLFLDVRAWAAEGAGTLFFDQLGTPISVERHTRLEGKRETVLDAIICEAGAFRVEFVRDTLLSEEQGFYSSLSGTGDKTLGEERRDVVCAVLRDLSRLLNRPPQSEPVRIQVRSFYDLGNATAARASSVFIGRVGEAGVLDGAIWTTLNSGRDAYATLDFAPDHHGFIEVNFARKFNTQYDAPNFTGIDLYSVILHEIVHALGFGSFILPEGVSVGSKQALGYYSRYDTHLYVKRAIARTPLSIADACYAVRFNPAIAPANLLADCADSRDTALVFRHLDGTEEYIYAPKVWEEGSSLSHLSEQCSEYSFLMAPDIGAGIAKRTLHEREVRMLCDLGYSITGRYGTDSLTGRYALYEQCSCAMAVGVNDSLGIAASGGTIEIALSELVGNDIRAAEADCIEIIEGSGSLSSSRLWAGDSVITLTTAAGFYGNILLRYIPKGDRAGNITYVSIAVLPADLPPCESVGCNYVCNGGFETNVRFGGIASWRMPKPFIQGWWAASTAQTEYSTIRMNTPDIWRRLPGLWGPDSLANYDVDGEVGLDREVPGFPGGDYPVPDFPPLDTWDQSPLNKHFGGMHEFVSLDLWGSEAFYQRLAKPLRDDGTKYIIEFHGAARTLQFTPRDSVDKPPGFVFRVYGDTLDPGLSDTARPPVSLNYIFGSSVVQFGEWQKVKIGPFTVPSVVEYLHIQGYPLGLPDRTDTYGFIDDVIIREAGVGIDTYVSDTYPCIGEEVVYTFHVCKDDPNDRHTSVSLIDNFPQGLRYSGGDFAPDGAGRLFAVVAPERFDTSNCAVLILRAIVDSAAVGIPLVNTIIPAGMDSSCTDALGKTKTTIYPAEQALKLSLTAESPVCINEEVDVRIDITNSSILPLNDAMVSISLGATLELVRGSVVINGVAVQDQGLLHKAYTLVGERLLFPQLDIQPGTPTSGAGLNRTVIQFRLRCKGAAIPVALVATIASQQYCSAADTAQIRFLGDLPIPNLQDTTSCTPVLLTAMPLDSNQYHFRWSTGDTTRSITIADSSTVWVAVTNVLGCTGYDTCHISRTPVLTMNPEPGVLTGEPGQKVSFKLVPNQEQLIQGRLYPFLLRLQYNRKLLSPEWLAGLENLQCVEAIGDDCIVEVTGKLGLPLGGYIYPEFRFRVLNSIPADATISIKEFVWLDCQEEIPIADVPFEMQNSLRGTIRQTPVGNFSLEQNYPNPFSDYTHLVFEITRRGHVEMIITDMSGKEVATIVSGTAWPGRYLVSFQAGRLSSGIYSCVLKTSEGVLRKTMLLLR